MKNSNNRNSNNEVLFGSNPSNGTMREIVDEAVELAHEAYENQNASAKAHAERLLFLMNVNSSFAPPLQSSLALSWNILMNAKLKEALRPHLRNGQGISVQEMKSRLERAIADVDSRDHSFLDEITQASDPRGLIIYTKNWFCSTYGFTQQLISLAQHCTGELQKVVLHNLSDEFDGTEHGELRERFLKRIGGSTFDPKAALEDSDQLVESFSLLNYRTAIATMQNPSFALGSFYSIEAAYPPVCRRLAAGLRKRGLEELDIETFTLHLEKDEDHAAEWLELLENAPLSPQDREYVVAGALAQMQIRHEMFEAMKQKSLFPEHRFGSRDSLDRELNRLELQSFSRSGANIVI